MTGQRQLETSLKRLKCANTGHSPDGSRPSKFLAEPANRPGLPPECVIPSLFVFRFSVLGLCDDQAHH